MTFNPNARVDTSKVQRRRGGGGAGRGIKLSGGGLLGALVLFLASQYLGVDLGPLAGQITGGSSQSSSISQEVGFGDSCRTGADANNDDECRMAAAADSIDRYWQGMFTSGYRTPEVVLYRDYTSSACGTASAQTGPFYCSGDEGIYMDTQFFNTLRTTFNTSAGPLAQMYVMAHEWGHHVQHLTGQLSSTPRDSGATSAMVRLELQADCYAGAWMHDAANIKDDNGVTFMQPVSYQEMQDALDAAAAIGDDTIQEMSGRSANPDSFTHGTSAQRMHWLRTGYEQGANACDTFSVPAEDL